MEISSLIVGAIIGAIPSWIISRSFAKRSSKELEDKLNTQASRLESATTFNNFERMLRTSQWRKENIGHDEIWICERNNTFQIHMCDDHRDFKEAWTSVFSSQNTTLFHINLTIGGTIVKSLPFINADGGNYTLPLPELAVINNAHSFYWSPNSVEVKVAEIIGNFYRHKSIKEVAEFTKIELHTVSNHA